MMDEQKPTEKSAFYRTVTFAYRISLIGSVLKCFISVIKKGLGKHLNSVMYALSTSP